MQRIIQIVTLSALMTTPALAQIFDGDDEVSGRNFAGVMGGRTELRTDDVPDLNFLTFTARIGHDFNQYFGLELRGGLTGDDEAEGIEASIPYFGSVLARIGWLPVDGNRLSIYGLAGYTGAELKAQFRGVMLEEKAGGPSFGAGVELLATEHHGLNIEYVRYLDKEVSGRDVKVSHFGIGYVFRF